MEPRWTGSPCWDFSSKDLNVGDREKFRRGGMGEGGAAAGRGSTLSDLGIDRRRPFVCAPSKDGTALRRRRCVPFGPFATPTGREKGKSEKVKAEGREGGRVTGQCVNLRTGLLGT